jgi:hypothetical protein
MREINDKTQITVNDIEEDLQSMKQSTLKNKEIDTNRETQQQSTLGKREKVSTGSSRMTIEDKVKTIKVTGLKGQPNNPSKM